MKTNKKAGISLGMRTLALLILLLVSSFFILYFEVYAGEKVVQSADACLCRLSVDRAASTKVFETPSRFGLDCSTRYVNIYLGDEYKEKAKGERVDYYISNSSQLKEIFAKEIALGYWEMGAGISNPYPNLVTLTKGRNSRCVITAQITVDQKVINSYGPSLLGLEKYLDDYQFNECGIKRNAREIIGRETSFDRIDLTRNGKPITLSVVWGATITDDLQRAKWITDTGTKIAVIGTALSYIPGVEVIGKSISFAGIAGTAGGIGYNLVTIGDNAYLFSIAVGPADEVGKSCGQLY
ncbi:hypothetical protein KY335_04725 [Candidatus Woesearchaeota archaeon]|nr:hypothetical protein [Candidatus Woesearchaeota archaeon]MBW3014512.1 hypothetical protein [Candidatus Woesearchaeota archaeon]